MGPKLARILRSLCKKGHQLEKVHQTPPLVVTAVTYINHIGRMPFLWQLLFNSIFFVSSSHGALLWFSFHFSTMKTRSKTIYLRLLNCSVEIFAGKTSNIFVCQSGPKELLVGQIRQGTLAKILIINAACSLMMIVV